MNKCACVSTDERICFAARYGISLHEVEPQGGPCECCCHDREEDEDDIYTCPVKVTFNSSPLGYACGGAKIRDRNEDEE